MPWAIIALDCWLCALNHLSWTCYLLIVFPLPFFVLDEVQVSIFFFFFVGFFIFNLLNREKTNIFGILGIISLQKCNCFFVCHSLMQANMIDKFFFCTLVNSLSNLSRLYLILLLNMCLAHRLNYSNFSTS